MVVLILCATDHVSAQSTETGTDGGPFKATSALTADDAADTRAAESADDSACASVASVGAGDQ